ncbi:YcgN family cysteine cluster protein [Mangrovimicrobium sediminis]|uniref:UPF0260 protein E4634_11140 n=1 Tax=Mangrovimicrobium sediminis TaxID=2562682 RepID=A0A4Z0M1U0_9GAMM|nr:YcgN family cysteine cluster protein [Haliea sp. SAOS-164]TGD73572.1 YcgN family cysteine cluster protein [Haliea sp. SAOS-164]
MSATEWWHELPLQALDATQWEALCDGCARCCLHKLEDAETGELLFTRVHCTLLDADTCRCSDYPHRQQRVPGCASLAPDTVAGFDWLPATCAYRLRAEGLHLPEWHHLVSGSRETVHEAGISARGWTISEDYVHPDGYDEHIVHWVEQE